MERLVKIVIVVICLFSFTCLTKQLPDDTFKNGAQLKRSETELGSLTPDDIQWCSLAYSCKVEYITSNSITLHWPCCAGRTFLITSSPSHVTSRNRKICDCTKSGVFPNESEEDKSFTTTDCFATIKNLCPYEDYEISIKSGEEGCSLIGTTLPSVPVWGKKAISEDSIHLSWEDSYCTDYKQPIYEISWTDPDEIEIVAKSEKKELSLNELLPATKYVIKLRACDNDHHVDDDNICSESTTTEVVTEPGTSTESQNLTATPFNSTAIILAWNPPKDPRGPIDIYNVICRKGSGRIVTNTFTVDKHKTTSLVTGLRYWTNYTCTVQAINFKSDGTFIYGRHATTKTTTKPDKPSEPVQFRVLNITAKEVFLSWKRSSAPRGPLDGYFLLLNKNQDESHEILSSSSREHIIKNLNPGTVYHATLFAFNYDSYGIIKEQVTYFNGTRVTVPMKTKATAPSTPRDVRVVKVTAEEMLIKWKRPSRPGGPIDGYVIRVENDESEEILSGRSLKYRLTDLSPGTNYTVVIFAFNFEGDRRLDGEQVIMNNKTKDSFTSEIISELKKSFDDFSKFYKEDTSSKLTKIIQLLNETHRNGIIENNLMFHEKGYSHRLMTENTTESNGFTLHENDDEFHTENSTTGSSLLLVTENDQPEQEECGGRLFVQDDIGHYFYSHFYYDIGNYDNNVNCEWILKANEGRHVKLHFLTFEIEYQENCTYDKVEIYDGQKNSNNLIGRYCGSKIPETIISTTNSLLVRFQSDSSVPRRGFSASYQQM